MYWHKVFRSQSINQSYLYQATKPIVAKPNICNNKKQTQHYNTAQLLSHRQTQEKGNYTQYTQSI